MEVVVRAGFVAEVATVDERDTRGLVGAVGDGFVPAARLCREAKGARFTPSETDALGREEADAAEPAGDTTGRVPLAEVVGLAEAEADNEGFAMAGADGLAGTTDSLRLGGAVGVRDEAIGVFEGAAAEALVDCLRAGATEGLAVARLAVATGFVGGALPTAPAPNVPELMIFFTRGVGGPPFDLPVEGLTDIEGLALVEVCLLASGLVLTSISAAMSTTPVVPSGCSPTEDNVPSGPALSSGPLSAFEMI